MIDGAFQTYSVIVRKTRVKGGNSVGGIGERWETISLRTTIKTMTQIKTSITNGRQPQLAINDIYPSLSQITGFIIPHYKRKLAFLPAINQI